MSEFFTPAEVAERYKISPALVYRKIHSGEWECVKLSNRMYRFTKDQVEAIAEPNAPARRANKKRMHDALKRIAN